LMVRSECRARDQARLDANLISQNNKGFPRFWLARVLLRNPEHTRQSWAGFFYLILRRKDMKKLILASAILAAFGANVAQAADAAPAPEHAVSYNIGVTSDYRYRGISQTQKDPALSLGVDYAHNPSGFYAGMWASTIKWIKDGYGGSGNLEIDLYAGRKGEIYSGISYDLGLLSYQYPNNKLGNVAGYADATTLEAYGQVGMGPFYVKYSHSLTNLFGNVDSKGSYYIDGGANVDVAEGLVLNVHAGRQVIHNWSALNYNDYKVGLTKDFGFAAGSLAYITTDADVAGYTWNGKTVGKSTVVATLVKTF